MKQLFFLVIFTGYVSAFSQDTILLPAINIEGFGFERVLMNKGSYDEALSLDTSKHPIITIDGNWNPVSDFICKTVTYPPFALEMGIQWNIYAIFNVETNGKISNIDFLKKGDESLNMEVLRVLKSIPDFPKEDHIVSYIIPFKFKIRDAVTYKKTLISRDELNGAWKLVKQDIHIVKEYYKPDPSLNHFRMLNDTVWYMEYPNQFYRKILSNINDDFYTDQNAWFQHDTLIIYNSRLDGGFYYYLRDTFDQKIFNQLVNDTIYCPSLFRKWYVETERPDDIEYGPPIKVKYPVYMPPVFKFDETDIAEKRIIYLNINGKKQQFKIVKCSLKYGFLLLESLKWSKEKFTVKYFTEKREYDIHGFRK